MDTIKELSQIDWLYLCGAILSAIISFKLICASLEWLFIDKLGLETKWSRQKKEDHQLLLKTINNLTELEKKHDAETNMIQENQVHYRQQSLQIQNDWKETQDKIFESLSDLTEKINIMKQNTDQRFEKSEQKQNKRIRAELKDKIGRSYRYYHAEGQINNMELEALADLIAEYEAAEGQNSFVHSVVQKEMYTWDIIE